MTRRPVRIEHTRGAFIVLYCDRTKGRHYSPAQFNDVDFSLEEVKAWVKNNPKLELNEQ